MIEDADPNAILVADAAGVIARVLLRDGHAAIACFTGRPLVDIAMAPNGELWGTDGARLLRINRSTGRAIEATGASPPTIKSLSFDPDGVARALDADDRPICFERDGSPAASSTAPGWVTRVIVADALITIEDGAEIGRARLAAPLAALANPRGDGLLYGVAGSRVFRVDPASAELTPVADTASLGMTTLTGATATLESAVTTALPRFTPDFYLRRNPDVAAAGVDPWRHFLEFGWREGRSPSPKFTVFDPGYMALTRPNEVPGGVDPWPWFLEEGWRLAVNPSPDFDTARYLAENPDVAAAGVNPLVHYLLHGMTEGRPTGFREWVV